jgi:quinol monooxygenase YgiN
MDVRLTGHTTDATPSRDPLAGGYAHGMSQVHLSGQLVCRDQDQAAVVAEHLSDHVARTRAEPGCISFSVASTDDPMVWQVNERFQDSSALKAHQDRVSGSAWGRVTEGIERRYAIDKL